MSDEAPILLEEITDLLMQGALRVTGREHAEREANRVLLALAGRLMAPVVETREEWQAATNGVVWPCDRAYAWRKFGELMAEPDKWSNVRVECRTVSALADGSELRGPWREVSA